MLKMIKYLFFLKNNTIKLGVLVEMIMQYRKTTGLEHVTLGQESNCVVESASFSLVNMIWLHHFVHGGATNEFRRDSRLTRWFTHFTSGWTRLLQHFVFVLISSTRVLQSVEKVLLSLLTFDTFDTPQ